MQKITLIFPNTSSLASFLIGGKIRGAEVDSANQSLRAVLTNEEMTIAKRDCDAKLKDEYYGAMY